MDEDAHYGAKVYNNVIYNNCQGIYAACGEIKFKDFNEFTLKNNIVQKDPSANALYLVRIDKTTNVDVRLLAATNRNLEQEVENKRFRADLFHRLNVYPINVAALRKRKEDIPLLAGHFCERIQRRLGLGPVRINPDSYDVMTRYEWPGNVRELENIISRAVLKASSDTAKGAPVVIFPSHLGSDLISTDLHHSPSLVKEKTIFKKDFSFNDEVRAYKREMIHQAIEKNNGNWAAAARDLNMHRSNLHNLAKRLGLKS